MNSGPKVIIRFPQRSDRPKTDSKQSCSTSTKTQTVKVTPNQTFKSKLSSPRNQMRRSSLFGLGMSDHRATRHEPSPLRVGNRDRNYYQKIGERSLVLGISEDPDVSFEVSGIPGEPPLQTSDKNLRRVRTKSQFNEKSLPSLGKRSHRDLAPISKTNQLNLMGRKDTPGDGFIQRLRVGMKQLRPDEKRRYSVICGQIMNQFLDDDEWQRLDTEEHRRIPDRHSVEMVSIQNKSPEDSPAEFVPRAPVSNPFTMSLVEDESAQPPPPKKIRSEASESGCCLSQKQKKEIRQMIDRRFTRGLKQGCLAVEAKGVGQGQAAEETKSRVLAPLVSRVKAFETPPSNGVQQQISKSSLEGSYDKPKTIVFRIKAEINDETQKDQILQRLNRICEEIPEISQLYIEKNIRKAVKGRSSIYSKRSSISSDLTSRRNSLRYFSKQNVGSMFEEDNSKMNNLLWNITLFFEDARKEKLLKQMKRSIQNNLKIASNEGQDDELGVLLLKLSLQVKITEAEFNNLQIEEKLRFLLLFVSKYINKKKIVSFFEPFMMEVDISSEIKLLASLK